MDVDSGRFTVPVSGVYMFLLNVYAAPRDPVVLSLRSVSTTLRHWVGQEVWSAKIIKSA